MSTYKKMMNLRIRENQLEQAIDQLDPNSVEWEQAYEELTDIEHEIAELNYQTDYKYSDHFK